MARALAVEIIGDSRKLEAAFARSAKSAKKFNAQIGRMSGRTSGAFGGLARSVALASASFLGGAGLVAGIRSSVTAASDLSEEVGRSNVVFGAASKGVQEWAKGMDKVGLSQRAALASSSTFATLTKLTGDEAVKQSKKLTVLGADLASFYNTDVQQATDALRSGIVGESEPLRKYGIQLSETRVQAEALRETGKSNIKNLTQEEKVRARLALIFADSGKAQGDAERSSGRLAQKVKNLRAELENVQAALGQALIPFLTEIVTKFSDWISKTENQKQLLADVKQVVGIVAGTLDALKTAFEELVKVTGSMRGALKLLLGVFVTWKAMKIAKSITDAGTAMGLFAGNTTKAAKGATGLKATLGRSAGAGDAGLIIAVGALSFALTTAAINALHLDDNLRRAGSTAYDVLTKVHAFGISDPTAQFEGKLTPEQSQAKFLRSRARRLEAGGMTPQEAADRLVKQHPLLAVHDAQVFAGVTAAKPTIQGLVGAAVKGVNQAVADAFDAVIKKAGPPSKARQKANEAFRQQIVDRLQFAVDRTALTKSIADDLAALNKLNDLLLRRINSGHKSLDLQRQQLQVQLQINDLLAQQADARKAAREAAHQAALDARDRRQFRTLGFGPQGQDLVPGVRSLRQRAEAMRKSIEDTFLDTGKNRRLISAIRKVLAAGPGAVSEAVRAKIQQLLDDLARQRKQFVSDAGLRQRTPSGQFVGAGARGHLVINGGVHLHGIQNVKEFEEALARRSGQRVHPRRVR